MQNYSAMSHGVYHGEGAEARANLWGEVPILSIDLPGGWVGISPSGVSGDRTITEDHARFAHELVTAAEQYRDAIDGARFWAEFDQPPADAEGAA